MTAPLGQRSYRVTLVALVLGAYVITLGVLFAKDQLTNLATLCVSVFGPIVGAFAGHGAAEWTQRRKDPSTIAEQTAAERGAALGNEQHTDKP